MALLVSDRIQEDFSKPPPKKKWLQEYIEKDAVSETTKSITENLSTEAREFVRLFDKGTDEMINDNLKQLTDNKSVQGKMTLSQEVIGGVVQGVLDQFQSFFEAGCNPNLLKMKQPQPEESRLIEPVKEESGKGETLTQQDIAPVVQSVISQFLNGNLADTDFRRSRKRSHKHINCRHKDDFGGVSARVKRCNSVIKYKSREQDSVTEEPLKVQHLLPEQDENEALNLCLPKPVPKVTFATRDRCYTTDCPTVKSFQTSKSEELLYKKHLVPKPRFETLPPSPPHYPLPVIRHTSSSDTGLNMSSKKHESLIISSRFPRQLYPRQAEEVDQISTVVPTSFPVIKPRMIRPLLDFHSSTNTNTSSFDSKISSRVTKDHIPKEDIKKTSSSTRETHNRLEKNRRAHLKLCFDELALECSLDPKKTSNLTVIRSAYKFTMSLKRKERENEKNMASLVQQKIRLQQRLEELKSGFPSSIKSDSESE